MGRVLNREHVEIAVCSVASVQEPQHMEHTDTISQKADNYLDCPKPRPLSQNKGSKGR